jgi:hypothetical protein
MRRKKYLRKRFLDYNGGMERASIDAWHSKLRMQNAEATSLFPKFLRQSVNIAKTLPSE